MEGQEGGEGGGGRVATGGALTCVSCDATTFPCSLETVPPLAPPEEQAIADTEQEQG